MTTIERGGPRGRRGAKPAREAAASDPVDAPARGGAAAKEAAKEAVKEVKPSRRTRKAAASADVVEAPAKPARKPRGRAAAKAASKAEPKTTAKAASRASAKAGVKTGSQTEAGTVVDPAPGRVAPRRRAPARETPTRELPGRRQPDAPKPAKAQPAKAQPAKPKEPARDGRPRAPFVLLLLCLMGGALVCLLVLNTVLARDSFTLSALQKSERQLLQEKQQLVEDIAREEAPDRLALKAENEGMVQPEKLAFVDPVDGTVTGGKKRQVPSAAAAAAAAAGVIGVPGAIVPGDGIPGYTGPEPGVQTDPAAPGER
ncbi:hypothetical protein [Actinocorallia sp. A-T 12471]|uniref:hypothetical protein n=1 Tax=Actinocorallia sp. A-T 12471 TaxID=3089813 RepID=UPI0029D213C8|nr:hypothetical protein [Actinocorallia sp. A-T 12471]MDX6743078.1 hypothetical protein [Actinocorallia sp. A-T 12471]